MSRNRPAPDTLRVQRLVPEPPRDWYSKAACKGMPAEAFYPGEGEKYDKLDGWDTCKICPARIHCLAFALRGEERFGLFGGTSAEQRQVLIAGLARGTMKWADVARVE